MRVDNPESGAGEAVLIIQLGSAEVRGTLGIHKNLCSGLLDDLVARSLGIDLHHVLETGAAPFLDGKTKSFAGTFRGNEIQKGVGGLVGESDHGLFLKTIPCKVKWHGKDSTAYR